MLFGATGDLAARRLLPGLYRLYQAGLMPAGFRIIGSGRHALPSGEALRARVCDAVENFGNVRLDKRWEEFAARLSFVASDEADGTLLAAVATNTRSKNSSKQVAWRSSLASAVVRSRGGSSLNVPPAPRILGVDLLSSLATALLALVEGAIRR